MEKKFQEDLGVEIKKSHKTETIVTFIVLAVVVLLMGGGIWYYISNSPSYDVTTTNTVVNQKKTGSESTTGATSETANWKTFTDNICKYSVKYPDTWVYKDYGAVGGSSIAFADKTANLPPEQSDSPAIIGANCQEKDLESSITTDPTKITKETITVAGKTAKKWTLLPGRTNDMDGDTKYVYVSVPNSAGKFIWITNSGDRFSDIYTKMLTTLKIQ